MKWFVLYVLAVFVSLLAHIVYLQISKCQGMSATGDAMDSDEEDEDPAAEAALNAELHASTLEAIAEGAAEADEEEEEPTMTVDPDGWETVARGKTKPGRKKK
jgi:hypothetical protein